MESENNKINCSICNDDGKCLNNELNPNYDDDWFGSDYWDCVDYLEKKNNTIGETMKNWISNLQRKNKDDYKSDFVKWSENHK